MNRRLTVNRVPSSAAEPVSLEEAKAHLSLDGDDHDSLLTLLISAARRHIEDYCNISLVDATVTARWQELERYALPYGPVTGEVAVEGPEATQYALSEGDYPEIAVEGYTGPVTLTYAAGLNPVPEPLKLAILKHLTDDFQARTGFVIAGRMTVQHFPNSWKSLAKPYRQLSWVG